MILGEEHLENSTSPVPRKGHDTRHNDVDAGRLKTEQIDMLGVNVQLAAVEVTLPNAPMLGCLESQAWDQHSDSDLWLVVLLPEADGFLE